VTGAVLATGLIVWGIVEAARPPWVTALLAALSGLVAIALALFGPRGLISRMVVSRRQFESKDHRRLAEMERERLAGRSSSTDPDQPPLPLVDDVNQD